MTQNIVGLVARLKVAQTPGGPASKPRPAGAWTHLRAHGRFVALTLVGLGVCIGILVDDPRRPPQVASPTSTESGDRFIVVPENLPRTADGRPMTWGVLFDLYGLEDETLRRSLEATLERPFSLADARSYRGVVVGQRTVAIVLRPAPSRRNSS